MLHRILRHDMGQVADRRTGLASFLICYDVVPEERALGRTQNLWLSRLNDLVNLGVGSREDKAAVF